VNYRTGSIFALAQGIGSGKNLDTGKDSAVKNKQLPSQEPITGGISVKDNPFVKPKLPGIVEKPKVLEEPKQSAIQMLSSRFVKPKPVEPVEEAPKPLTQAEILRLKFEGKSAPKPGPGVESKDSSDKGPISGGLFVPGQQTSKRTVVSDLSGKK
jgi:hypothetical protein